jgi:ABC-type transport system substrate-binding protein
MKKLMTAVVIASVLMAGCTTSGGTTSSQDALSNQAQARTIRYAVNPATIATFKTGVTTIDQVEVLLGKPAGMVRTPAGHQVIAYTMIRSEDLNSDRTPVLGTALPPRHKVRYTTLLSFDQKGYWITSWTRTDDLGNASPTALGHFDMGDVLGGVGNG